MSLNFAHPARYCPEAIHASDIPLLTAETAIQQGIEPEAFWIQAQLPNLLQCRFYTLTKGYTVRVILPGLWPSGLMGPILAQESQTFYFPLSTSPKIKGMLVCIGIYYLKKKLNFHYINIKRVTSEECGKSFLL